jgi:parallel beta-helix repeat protein
MTDGDSLTDRLWEKPKRSSWVPFLAVVLVAVLMVGAVSWLTVQIVNNRSEYTKHSPISIDGNGGFTHASGVVRGSGTVSDPYIIADWDINASTREGISIGDTDAHFIIRNCYVHDGSVSWSGIYLVNCFNGTLENNVCSRNQNGMTLDSSGNNTLVNNTCSSNSHDGIVVGSSNIELINNNCSSNDYDGIYLVYSSNSTLRNNICKSDGHAGISLDRSNNNALSNNNCSSNDYDGIYLYSSSNNTLWNNICSSNSHDGMHLNKSSNNNEISWSLVWKNAGYGMNISLGDVILPSGSTNHIWYNIYIGNNGATDTYNASHAQARDDGTNNWWNSTDVYGDHGNYWSDWTTPDAVSPLGIVDHPYFIFGSAGAKDYYPLSNDPRYIQVESLP